MLEDLAKLSDASTEFTQQYAQITAKKQMTRQTMKDHAAMLEILELPQLMDICVRYSLPCISLS